MHELPKPPSRLRGVLLSIWIGLLIAFVAAYQTDTEAKGMLKRGDFPGFYVLSVLIDRNQHADLYNFALQEAIEAEFWPSMRGTLYVSVYPPFTALALAPLAKLPAIAAKHAFCLVMLLSTLAAVAIARGLRSSPKPSYWYCLSVLVLCLPVFVSIVGAQNTGLSMLLFALGVWGLCSASRVGELLAGIAWSVWLYKPQFGVFALLYLFLFGSYYARASAAVAVAALYLGTALIFGPNWPLNWLQALAVFGAQNQSANAQEIVSAWGLVRYLGTLFSLPTFLWQCLGALLTLLALALPGVALMRARKLGDTQAERCAWLLLGPVIVLVSPQTLFYDLGIGLLSLLALVQSRQLLSAPYVTLALTLFSGAFFMREATLFPLFSLFALGTLLLCWRQVGLQAASKPPRNPECWTGH